MAERTFGPRFDGGGYQGPRTDAATFKRERPILREELDVAGGTVIELVPYTGGKPGTFQVEATWTEHKEVAGQFGPTRCHAAAWFDGKGEAAARAWFAELVHMFSEGIVPPWPEDAP